MRKCKYGNERVIEQLPASLQKFLTYERFHLHKPERFQDPEADLNFDCRYLPQNCNAFELPCLRMVRKNVQVYGSLPPDTTRILVSPTDDPTGEIIFPLHPITYKHFRSTLIPEFADVRRSDSVRIWAVPTSSTRTLLIWPDEQPEQAMFVKTSLHSQRFGDRRIHMRNAACSIGLCNLAQQSIAELPANFRFFREALGIVTRRGTEIGVILRLIPQEMLSGKVVVAPLFALLGGSEQHRPLLLSIVERCAVEARTFVNEFLCTAFCRLWLRLVFDLGFLIEAHGQDLLFSLSPDGEPTGAFYYRDFEGLQIDWELRRRRSLLSPEAMPREWLWHETYETWGYRGYQLISSKLRSSLFVYLNYMLKEVENSVRDWQMHGALGGKRIREGELIKLFFASMNESLKSMFGVSVIDRFQDERSLTKFVIQLMNIRRELLAQRSTINR
jgi:hypothetical protein